MMVVDTSALLAILFDEREKALFEAALAAEERNIMSALNLHEAGIVMRGRHGPAGVARLMSLVATHSIGIVAFDDGQALAAWTHSTASAKESIPRRASTSATAPRTRSRRPEPCRSCSRAMISRTRTSWRRCRIAA